LFAAWSVDNLASVRSNPSISWALYGNILIVVQRPGIPTDGDWIEYMLDASGTTFTGVLVIGEGSKLSPTQRVDVEQLVKQSGANSAVVTSSALTRGVVTALRWFGVPMKAFALWDLSGALDFLAVPAAERDELLATVEQVKALTSQPRASARSGT
jgi:hypothetical protein